MKRMLFLVIWLLISAIPAFAYPPFAGGPVTGQYGETRPGHTHAGIDVGFDNTIIYAPWDGYAEHRDTLNNDYGEASVKIIGANGEGTLLFADLSYDTLNYPDGFVKEGTPIGIVSGYVYPSSGPHVHVEYRMHTDWFGGSTLDPVPILIKLGVALDGAASYGSPMDQHTIPWTVEGMYQMGKDFSHIIKTFSLAANKAAGYLYAAVIAYLLLLCTLDLTVPIALRGMVTNKRELVPKLFKYAGMIAIVGIWTSFTDTILLNFVTTTTSAFSGNNPVIPENLSNPQLILQHVLAVINPALNKISTFTAMEWMRNFGYILALYSMTIVVIAAWAGACFYVVLTYVEFYLSAGLSLVTAPFAANKFTRFIAEGGMGHLVAAMLRLLFIAVIIGISVTVIQDAKPADIFKIGLNRTETTPSSVSGSIPDGNAYTGDIALLAQKYGIDPYIAIAIAMRESGGDTVEGIHMAEGYGAGIMQIDPGQDIVGPDGSRVTIQELFPNYATDPAQNIEAGMAILRDKINMMDGDIWAGVTAYNGGGDPNYLASVQANYAKISGKPISAIGHTFLTGEMVSRYFVLCLSLVALAALVIIVPRAIVKQLGGPIVLSR